MASVLSQPAQERANPRVYDGFISLNRGVHSGRAKDLLSANHVQFAVNTTFRKDHPRPRPGWKSVPLDDSALSTEQSDALFLGKWQGATVYQNLDGEGQLVLHKAGRLFAIDVAKPGVNGRPVNEITPFLDPTLGTRDLNDPTLEQTWFAQSPGYLVIQNGQDRAIIYDGSISHRSDPAKYEVPTGTVTAFGQGRFWVASVSRDSFVGSDLIYDPNVGSPSIQFRDACLYFSENTLIDSGGAFGVPLTAGKISSMQFAGNMDTSTGQGPMQVFTEDSVFTVDPPFDRQLWTETTNPIQTVGLPSGGTPGQNTAIVVNGDIWYRDRLGVRSFQISRREFGTWSNTPLSRAVDAVMKYDDPNLLRFGSAVEFDNRLLMTVCPQLSRYDPVLKGPTNVYHLGVVALDFAHVSDTDDLGVTQTVPVWEGLWTGLKILQLVVGIFGGVRRCFAFTLDNADETLLQLWELTQEAWMDDYTGEIEWKLYTPSYPFGDMATLKLLKKGELWLNDLQGTPSIELAYQPDDYPRYTDWYSWSLCASQYSCDTEEVCNGLTAVSQVRASINIPEPTNECRIGQRSIAMNRGNTFSTRFVINGALSITRFRMCGIPQSDAVVGECQDEECEVLPQDCADYWWSYLIGV